MDQAAREEAEGRNPSHTGGESHGGHQGGVFYESGLRYNCLTNCNNWVNLGLRKAGLTNRVWAPLSFWI